MEKYDLIITGSQGNIGSRLLKKCPGHHLGIGREDWETIQNEKLEARAVIHCAFDLKHNYSENPQTMIESNILSTAKLLEFVKRNDIKKFIFISSCAVYGNSSNTSEENQCIPISINGNVKLINELFIREFCVKNKIRFHIFRVFNLFGGNDHFSVVSQLMKSIRNDIPFRINNDGVSQRDFIHVDDVCDIVCQAAGSELDFTVMNLGTGRSTQISELVDLAKAYKPHLKLVKNYHNEIEYSRANLQQLTKIFKKDFINVCDFLEQEIAQMNQV